MEWVKRWWTQIQAQLGELTVSQKLLIGTLLIVIPMMLWLVVQYAAEPQMVPVLDQPMDSSQRARITSYLDSRRIDYEMVGDRIAVPVDRRLDVLASLQMQKLLPEDTTTGFDKIIENQSWWQSSEQNRQLYLIAKQKVLSRVLAAYPWIQDATVIVSRPQNQGFGSTSQRPTASVNLVMAEGQINQDRVDSVAGLVSGAVAEMRPEDVTVIDAVAGRQWKTREDDQVLPGDSLETIQAQERYYREKLASALSYISNVIVAVNVDVDMTRKQMDVTRYSQDDSLELLTREQSEETETSEPGTGGEPGVRANAGANIAGAGGAAGQSSTTESSEAEFEAFPGRTHEVSSTPAGIPTRISATVNVPRSFFVRLFRQDNPDAAEPTDEALQPLIDRHLQRIEQQIRPLVTAEAEGQLAVDVYPDGGAPEIESDQAATAGTSPMLIANGYLRPALLGLLAVVSLAMMALMVRKATQKPQMPSAEELAGMPQQLKSDEEDEDRFMGEVGEDDDALPGMELDEETLKQRKLAKHVSDMVKSNPTDIATLINRWIKRPR